MVRPTDDWRLTARYLYTLSLSGADWAWEWLRRNPDYAATYALERRARRRARAPPCGRSGPLRDRAERWGLLFLEDPRCTALEAPVFWRSEGLANLLRAGARRSPAPGARRFELWSPPGIKAIAVGSDGAQVVLRQAAGTHHLLFEDRGDLTDEIALELRLDAPPEGHAQFEAARRFLFAARQARAPNAPVHPQAAIMMRMLQAVDGRRAGCSYRQIADQIFGPDEVAEDWHEHGLYKARVRYLLRRGTHLILGGYRDLLKPRRP